MLSAAIFVTLIGLLVYLHFVKIDQESLLIVGSLGIQMTSSYASGKESTTFIEMTHVKDVVINEAIYMVSCPCVLCHHSFRILSLCSNHKRAGLYVQKGLLKLISPRDL